MSALRSGRGVSVRNCIGNEYIGVGCGLKYKFRKKVDQPVIR